MSLDSSSFADSQANLFHRGFEAFAILRLVNDIRPRTHHFDTVLLQHAVLFECHGQVQAGLPTQGRQERIGPFAGDDLLQYFPRQRLDVGPIGRRGIGHDGGRIRVHQHHFVPFLAQRLACLGTGIVELASLTNDDRARTNDQDFVNVVAAWHVWQGAEFGVGLRGSGNRYRTGLKSSGSG